MKIPERLNKGDKLALISTARKITFHELNPSIEIIKSWGLKVVLGKNLFNQENQFSGTIQQRKDDLQEALDNEEIKAILCVRGGYGTIQIIDKIDFSNFQNQPKWIMGYSDITVLHSHLNVLGVASIHSTMPINFTSNTKYSLLSLKNILFKFNNRIQYKSGKYNRHGFVEGELVGGNLSIIYSLLSSVSDLETKNKILIIEDVDEYFYHIDRMMLALKRAGKFKNIKALIVGGFTEIRDNEISFGKKVQQIILDHIKGYRIPVCFDFPFGHLDDNRAVKLGVKTTLRITENDVILEQ